MTSPPLVYRLLDSVRTLERVITCAAFAVLATVIFVDVAVREFTGTGLIWAREVGVYANIMVTLVGIAPDAPVPVLAAGIDFALEGLYSHKKISRNDERGYHATEPVRRPQPQQSRTAVLTPDDFDDDSPTGKKKKKYYN